MALGEALARPLAGQGPGPDDGRHDRPHALALGVGLDHRALRDDQASPLRYEGAGLALEAAYRYDGARWHHRVDVSFRSTTLTSSITDHGVPAAELLAGRFRHAVLRDVGAWRELALRAGASIHGEGEQRDHTYIGTLGESYTLALLAAGPAGEASVRVSDRAVVEASLALPLVALVLRSPWATKGRFDVGVEPVGVFLRVLPRLSWRWRATDRLGLEVSLRGRYGRVAEPADRRVLDRSVVVRGEWSP
jgi:hypothetical protein